MKSSLLQQYDQVQQMNASLQHCRDILINSIIPLIPLNNFDDALIDNARELTEGLNSIKGLYEQHCVNNSQLFLEFDKLEKILMTSTLTFFKEKTVKLINSIAKDLDDFITSK